MGMGTDWVSRDVITIQAMDKPWISHLASLYLSLSTYHLALHFLNFRLLKNHLGNVFKIQIWGPNPKIFYLKIPDIAWEINKYVR